MSGAVDQVDAGRARYPHPPERQPPEVQTEGDDQQEAKPERRHGKESERRPGRDVIEDGVLAYRGQRSDRDREQHHDEENGAHQQNRVWQPLADEPEHRLMRYDRVAPVADHELAEPARVLERHWLIEAELVLESTNVGVGHVRIVLVSGEGAAGYRLQDR